MLDGKTSGSARTLKLLTIALSLSTLVGIVFLYSPRYPPSRNGLISSLGHLTGTTNPNTTTIINVPIILYWTTWFDLTWVKEGFDKCGQYQCYFTNNHSLYNDSSLIIFHAATIKLKRYIHDLRALQRPIGQRWVYVNAESPSHWPIQHPLKGPIFNWTMTYRLDSDVYGGYGRVLSGKYKDGFDPHKNYLEGKNIEVTVAISNCRSKERLKLVKALSKHMEINVLGHCGKKRVSVEERNSQIKRSKFYLAFENTICKDYITEKTYGNALSNGAVPVIMSGANLSNPLVMPPESYIDASKFNSAKELAQHLKYIGQNKERYNIFFKWRQHWTIGKGADNMLNNMHKCLLCEKLHKSKPTDIKVYDDLSGSKERETECRPYPSM